MKNPLQCLLLLLLISSSMGSMAADPGTYTNPVGDAPIHMGDPFAFWHAGNYYLIGTTAANDGFQCYTSTDLAHWRLKGWAWRKAADSWASGAFWAPEVKFYRGKFYLTYSGLVRGSKPNKLLMGLAVSDTPEGPYRDLHAPWFDPGYSTIDGHIFVDDDGTPYLYFSRNGSQDGYSFGINYGVPLARDLSKPIGEPVKLIEASQPWERVNWAKNRCNEGATVLKHNGRYYMTYSANHTEFPAYGVGYATAEKPLGPWTKAKENPILASRLELGISAPGHNSIVRTPDGREMFIIYHTHADPQQPSSDRVVNIDRLEFTADGKLCVKGPTRSPQPLPSKANEPMASASQTGSWGDQGNGKYKNPILESNYPDNDVIRVGDTFYMMTSTNHFVPGMMILKSRDLVNWEFSNNIMPDMRPYEKEFEIGRKPALTNRGVWAGSFGYNGEHYFAYWCFNNPKPAPKPHRYSIVYAKAKSIDGPWSQPRELTWPDGTSIDSTDPGVFWDLETHKAWLADNQGKIYRLSWDGENMLQGPEEGIVVTQTLRGEAAKIYKFDGMYYYMNAHVGDNDGIKMRMASFHRAKAMEGPWEGRLVLENGNGTDRHPSQGTLLKLDDGSWWFIHQLARGKPDERYNGRPQFLEPVTWKDGWPLIGVDADGDGIGEVVWEHQKPINGFPITAPATDDDFSKPALGLQWNWRFTPKMDRWSLSERPGFLRLKSCVAPLTANGQANMMMLPNLICQRLMGRHKNVMTAKLDVSGMASGQEGALHLSAGVTHAIGVQKDELGNMRLCFRSEAANYTPAVVTGLALKQSDLWLQARVENGLATFFYSLDGKTFTQLGSEVRLLFSGFTPAMVGFYSMNTNGNGCLDIDWFKYDYDGPTGK